MTEPMIPLSVIDALITSVEDFGENYRYNEVIELLEDLKKEAIPSPSEQDQDFDDEEDFQRWKKEYIEKPTHEQDKSVQEQGLEQKILQRIKEVESMTGGGEITRKSFLDELRKLLK